ncbi:MAG: hypothetical protein IT449_10860 [Phycisphaerales bacterium]|nr:hypothetical protein [Phycisphaerales bacterium]
MPVDAETFYYLTQELYTVTGVMKVNGTLTEAQTYDGYGAVRLWHYSDGDFNRDAAVNATDQARFTAALGPSPANGKPATDPLADLDLDGDVDLADSATFTTIKNSGGAMTQLFTSAAGNPFHFTGRRLYMLETLPESDTTPTANQQLQHNRARHYAPLEGRWLQRDPLRYVAGLVLYEYVSSSPPKLTDPAGLVPPEDWSWPREGQSDSEDKHSTGSLEQQVGTISVEVQSCCGGGSTVLVAAVYLDRTGTLRLQYEAAALQYLDRTDEASRIARRQLAKQFNELQTRLGQEITKAWGSSGRQNNAGKTRTYPKT